MMEKLTEDMPFLRRNSIMDNDNSKKQELTKKRISFCTCCYNEVNNVGELARRIEVAMKQETYEYEIVFSDNASTDGTQDVLRKISENNERIKVIINARNYGTIRSPRNALRYCKGDAVISIAADLQDPPELIPGKSHLPMKGSLNTSCVLCTMTLLTYFRLYLSIGTYRVFA